MMKIQGGKAKGRILRTLPYSPHVRPILARVRKSLFDILRPRLTGARFLDLFAGTGSVGLEALSQGVDWTSFVERDGRCVQLIEENIRMLGFEGKCAVYRRDLSGNVAFLAGPFDIIFMGPPYKDLEKAPLALVTPTLAKIDESNLLKEQGLIVAQHHKKEQINLPSEKWEIFRVEKYGDTILSFIRQIAV